ncbi:SGNH/GDSL hydrolase family protein [Lachnospiraceae bacterium C1.1]|nr:hypothetical protein [Lachnospiraceae bacterium C1.1]
MQEIRKLAEHYSIPVVDTIESFSNDYDNLTVDGVHPNDDGYKIYADSVASIIDEGVGSIPMYREADIEPVNECTDVFETFKWYGAEEF